MDWKKVFSSGMKGLLSAITGLLVAMIPAVQDYVMGFLPEKLATLTVGGIVAFLFNAARNWLKHKND